VSVLLDGVYVKNEAGDRVFAPLSAELIAQLEAAIKGVVGFDVKRGDLVSISSVQFARPEEISPWAIFVLEVLREFSRPFLNLILIILFFFLVVRPILNWLKHEVEPAGTGAQPAVLPEFPGGPGYGDGLPLPLPPQQPAAAQGEAEEEEGLALADQEAATDLLASPSTAALPEEAGTVGGLVEHQPDHEAEEEEDDSEMPDYEDEESLEAEGEEEVPGLAYGNLSRDNVLPLARENIDRTVGMIRGWIEQKPEADGGKQ
jgi:flagellar biosynthesis/type III secretory pathway M-ring protein FliF/YscJ